MVSFGEFSKEIREAHRQIPVACEKLLEWLQCLDLRAAVVEWREIHDSAAVSSARTEELEAESLASHASVERFDHLPPVESPPPGGRVGPQLAEHLGNLIDKVLPRCTDQNKAKHLRSIRDRLYDCFTPSFEEEDFLERWRGRDRAYKNAQDRLVAILAPAPQVPIKWSEPKNLKEWGRLYGKHPNTLTKYFATGKIRAQQVNRQQYRIAIDDLPMSLKK